MGPNKIYYFMNVPWGWIKQRPHFLAEQLSLNFDVRVYFKSSFLVKRRDLVTENNTGIKLNSYFLLPFYRIPILKNFKILMIVNDILIRIQVRDKLSDKIVWITSWSVYVQIMNCLTEDTKVIFDCMDDEIEFPKIKEDNFMLALAKNFESELFKRADLIICSSNNLKEKLISRYSNSKPIHVINNAINIFETTDVNIDETVKCNYLKIDNIFLYIGTISSWFDFDSIILMLEKNENANFVLIGPFDVAIPKHNRLHYFGTFSRDYLPFFIHNALVLTMPFKVNQLIESVDPVKIYEYIGFNKPIIATNYSEMDKFSNFCYLYKSSSDFAEISTKILNKELVYNISEDETKNFILKNTWFQRGKEVLKLIDKQLMVQNAK